MSGVFREVTFSPPFNTLAGDTLVRVGSTVEQRRAGVLIDSREIVITAVEPGVVDYSRQISNLFFFEEIPVPGQNVALTHVAKNESTGSITFTFSNGANIEHSDFDAVKDSVAYLDTTGETAQDILMLKTVQNSPDGTNLQNMVGGSVAINRAADVMVVLTNPN